MRQTTSIAAISAAFLLVASNSVFAVIINIDLEGYRTAGGGNNGVGPAVTYVGTGAALGGTVFNGITPTAVSDNSNSATTGDMQTLSSVGGLLDSHGVLTSSNFTIGPVGLDNESPSGTAATNAGSLFNDYVFNHANGNNANANFTISGLTAGGRYDVYLYSGSTVNIANTTIAGGALTTFTPTGVFSTGNTVEWFVVADGSGNISGTMGAGVQVLSGLTVATTTPEPSTLVLFGLGASGMLLAARRRRAAKVGA